MRVSLLIPSTSHGRDDWKNPEDTYLWIHTIQSFLLTKCPEHSYTFYIGVDEDDRIYSTQKSKDFFKGMLSGFDISVQFISMAGIKKGHLTVMWNRLFKKAYDDNMEYFFQCGDDITFRTNGWVSECIKVLSNSNGIGIAGPINNNSRILTQAMVSRRHMEIFGWFFPEEIINWCCDDWYNWVYQPLFFYPLKTHYCSNDGGQPRYVINNDEMFMQTQQVARNNVMSLRKHTLELANEHKILIHTFITSL